MVKHSKKAKAAKPPAAPSPVFDAVAYEAQQPGDVAAQDTVWNRSDIYALVDPQPTYNHRLIKAHTALQGRGLEQPPTLGGPSSQPAQASPPRSPTPEPPSPGPMQRTQTWAQPEGQYVPPMYQLPSMGFLHHLPRHMPPNHETAFYTTPNGLVTYRAYTYSDGVVYVTMAAPLEHLLALYDDLSDRTRRGG